jgi:hypothetical protein
VTHEAPEPACVVEVFATYAVVRQHRDGKRRQVYNQHIDKGLRAGLTPGTEGLVVYGQIPNGWGFWFVTSS